MRSTEGSQPRSRIHLAVMAALFAMMGFACLAALGVVSVQIGITIVAGMLTFFLLTRASRQAYWILFCIGVASTAFGHRGVYLGRWTYFVPLQVIVYALWLQMLTRSKRQREQTPRTIPLTLKILAVWTVLHGLAFLVTGTDWDSILSWSAPFVLGLPTFYVLGDLVARREELDSLLIILMLVAIFVSALGVLEYYVPALSRALPSFFTRLPSTAQGGFLRASFSFWGYPSAAILCSFGALIAYREIAHPSSKGLFWIALLAFILGGVAVYVSGQRASWVGLALGLFVIGLFGGARATLIGVAAALGAMALPGVFWERFKSVSDLLLNKVVWDGSIAGRLERFVWGWDAMVRSPLFGVGYGHWQTHDVFLEIGSTLGIIPVVLFGAFVIHLIWRVAQVALHGPTVEVRRYGWLFMALVLNSIEQLAVETFLFTPPFAAPQWVLLALAWYLPDILGMQPAQTVNRRSSQLSMHWRRIA